MIARRFIPLWITASLLLTMFLVGTFQFDGFASGRVVTNLLRDNAFLLITALGMTLVIISGGIDLSVGAVIALSGVVSSLLITEYQWQSDVYKSKVPVASIVGLCGYLAPWHAVWCTHGHYYPCV